MWNVSSETKTTSRREVSRGRQPISCRTTKLTQVYGKIKYCLIFYILSCQCNQISSHYSRDLLKYNFDSQQIVTHSASLSCCSTTEIWPYINATLAQQCALNNKIKLLTILTAEYFSLSIFATLLEGFSKHWDV